MLSLQSEELCGKGHIVGHLGIVEDLATFKIIQAIIPSGNPISNELEKFDSKYFSKIMQVELYGRSEYYKAN